MPDTSQTLHSARGSVLCLAEVHEFLQVGDRYRLVKLLGHGSFSSVCMALDVYTEEKV
jgi:hypothetical protein